MSNGPTFDYISTIPYPTFAPHEFIQDETIIVRRAFPEWFEARAAKLMYGKDYHLERSTTGMIVMCFHDPRELMFFESKVRA